MRKLVVLLVFALFGSVLVACGSDTGNNGGNGGGDNFKVGYMPNYASMFGVIPAIEDDIFDDHDLDVELVEFEDGPTIISALESGSIDAGYIGPGAHVLPIQGEAKIFAFSHLGNADEVIGNKKQGVESVEDLAGKEIGVSTGTSSETILNLALKEKGISDEDVTMTDMEASALVTAINSGGVDAVAAWSPNTSTIKNELGDDAVKLRENSDYKEEFPSIASWVVSPDYADDEDNAEKLQSFTKGLYEGMDYQDENENDTVKWIAEQTATDEEDVEAQTGDGEWKTSDEIHDLLEDGTIEDYYEKQQENFIESEELDEDEEVDVDEYLMLDNMEKATE